MTTQGEKRRGGIWYRERGRRARGGKEHPNRYEQGVQYHRGDSSGWYRGDGRTQSSSDQI